MNFFPRMKKNSESIAGTMLLIGVFTAALCLMVGTVASAGISKSGHENHCSICHQMGGSHSHRDLKAEYQGPQGCVNCHSSSESSTTYELVGPMETSVTVPVVYYTGDQAPLTYLAGGNFWWVKEELGGDDTKGHNIFPGEPDNYLDNAPGRLMYPESCGTDGACHESLHDVNTSRWTGEGSEYLNNLTGRQGCTKCHMFDDSQPDVEGWHHLDDSDIIKDSREEGWYRFLGAAHANWKGVAGVSGIEDDDWESETAIDHNEYLGSSGNHWHWGNFHYCGNTVNGFCTGCHNAIHVADPDLDPLPGAVGQRPWARHPPDLVIPDSGEFAAYTAYDALVPVALPVLSGNDGTDTVVVPGTDMVNCLSCHRAHGSPYPKMLRWDIRTNGGCIRCHTQKSQQPDRVFHGVGCTVCHGLHEYLPFQPPSSPLPFLENLSLVRDIVPIDSQAGLHHIVDNPQGTFQGNWPVSTSSPGYYGPDYQYHAQGSGSDYFRWTPTITTPGEYEVFTRWTSDYDVYRAYQAPYAIHHDSGTASKIINQRSGGEIWLSLGTYSFDGVDDYVQVTQTSTGYVIADAIQWTGPFADVVFTSRPAQFADGNTTYDGICEVCHTMTTYYRNDGSGAAHRLYSTGEHSGGPGSDCVACHSHANNFYLSMNQIHYVHFFGEAGPALSHNEDGCYVCHAAGQLQCQSRPLFADQNFLEVTVVCDACHSESAP
jgi:predicted CXXCH cytochrome family protein